MYIVQVPFPFIEWGGGGGGGGPTRNRQREVYWHRFDIFLTRGIDEHLYFAVCI
jgi:hypothetical protein